MIDDILDIGTERHPLSSSSQLDAVDGLEANVESFQLPYSDNPALFCRTHFRYVKLLY